MLHFNNHLFKTKYLLLITAIILILISFILPVEASFENHFFENLQVCILFIGFISILYKAKRFIKFKHFYFGCGFFYIIMIARELSWGRVFYPVGTRSNGEEIYISIRNIWYGDIVYPVVSILALIGLFLIIKCYRYCIHNRIIIDIPILYLIFFALLMLSSQLLFEKEAISFLSSYNQLLEEATEAIAYCSLVCFTYNWTFKINNVKDYFYVKIL